MASNTSVRIHPRLLVYTQASVFEFDATCTTYSDPTGDLIVFRNKQKGSGVVARFPHGKWDNFTRVGDYDAHFPNEEATSNGAFEEPKGEERDEWRFVGIVIKSLMDATEDGEALFYNAEDEAVVPIVRATVYPSVQAAHDAIAGFKAPHTYRFRSLWRCGMRDEDREVNDP